MHFSSDYRPVNHIAAIAGQNLRAALRGSPKRIVRQFVGHAVLAIVVGLYVEHTLSYVATHTQADRQQAIVTKLTRQNAQLAKEAKALNTPSTIVSQARALGMVRPNERAYVITGQPAP